MDFPWAKYGKNNKITASTARRRQQVFGTEGISPSASALWPSPVAPLSRPVVDVGWCWKRGSGCWKFLGLSPFWREVGSWRCLTIPWYPHARIAKHWANIRLSSKWGPQRLPCRLPVQRRKHQTCTCQTRRRMAALGLMEDGCFFFPSFSWTQAPGYTYIGYHSKTLCDHHHCQVKYRRGKQHIRYIPLLSVIAVLAFCHQSVSWRSANMWTLATWRNKQQNQHSIASWFYPGVEHQRYM